MITPQIIVLCDENNADVMQTIWVSSQIHNINGNNFSIGRFKIFSTAGTVFASLVGAPLLIFIITRFTLGGNKDAIPYADTYIKNSDTIVVKYL